MIEVGRLCIKIAGRDARKKCVIVDVLDDKFVLIDGETRRRKCNVKHIEPLNEMIKLKKGASHSDVVAEFKKLGINIIETKPRQEKPKHQQTRSFDRKKAAPEEVKKEKTVKKQEKPVMKKDTKLEKAIDEEK